MIESMTINLAVSKKVGGYKINGVVAGVAVEAWAANQKQIPQRVKEVVEAGIAERPGKP